MLRWMLALEKGKGGPTLARGLEGQVTAPKDGKIGKLLLEAAYTDNGAGAAGPLTGKTSVALRHPRIEAESGEVTGAKKNSKSVGSTAHGHTIRFTNLNLATTKSVTLSASAGGGSKDTKVEIRLDSATGPLVSTVDIKFTGDWNKFEENKAPLSSAPGHHDVFLVFVNPGKGGLMNLDWVQFNQ